MSRLCKHVSMISMSANAATYHDDDDDDNVDTIMLFTLIHKLTCITTTLLLEISIKQVNMNVI